MYQKNLASLLVCNDIICAQNPIIYAIFWHFDSKNECLSQRFDHFRSIPIAQIEPGVESVQFGVFTTPPDLLIPTYGQFIYLKYNMILANISARYSGPNFIPQGDTAMLN